MTDPYRPLKDAFGRFATGVAVAGCRGPKGDPVLITVNSFTSVSLEPPLVLWCLERRASSFPAFMGADAYSINVLNAGQQSLSEQFAQREPPPLAADEIEIWETGAPVLRDCLAAFDCAVKHRHTAGDHAILVAEVLKFKSAPGAPLIYFASNYVKGPEAER